jgi:hypothetical protein
MNLRFRNRLLFQEHSTANNAHHGEQINLGSAATEPVAIDSLDVIANVEEKPEGANTHPNDLLVEALLKEQLNAKVRDKQSFNDFIKTVYGNAYDRYTVECLRQRVLKRDFSWLPMVRFLDNRTLRGAYGAYHKESATVFINAELRRSPQILASAYVEEVGHHLDALINPVEAPGDEGELFRRLLAGEKLSVAEIQRLRDENDTGTIILDGKRIEVEFWSLKKAWKRVKKAVSDAVETVVDAVEETSQEFAEGVSDGVEGFFDNLSDGDVKGAFRALRDGLDIAFIEAPSKLLDRVIEASEILFYGTMGVISERFEGWMREKLGARLMELTRSGVTAIWEVGTSAARNIVEGLGTFFSGIGRLFTGDWKDGLKELGLGLLKIFIQTPIDGILLGGGKYLSAIQTIIWVESLGRRLNPNELDELYKVYRDSVDYKRVRVKVNKKRSGLFGVSDDEFTLGNTIYMKDVSGADFLPSLVHEVAHVWQFQHGGSDYMSEALWSQFFGKGYDWCRSVPGTKWRDLEAEQQAEFLEDVYESTFFIRDPMHPTHGRFLMHVHADCAGTRVGEDLTTYANEALEEVRAGRGVP